MRIILISAIIAAVCIVITTYIYQSQCYGLRIVVDLNNDDNTYFFTLLDILKKYTYKQVRYSDDGINVYFEIKLHGKQNVITLCKELDRFEGLDYILNRGKPS